jgi:hypothetical protein
MMTIGILLSSFLLFWVVIALYRLEHPKKDQARAFSKRSAIKEKDDV